MYRMARSNWSSLNSSRIWMGSQPAVSGFVLTNIWGENSEKILVRISCEHMRFFGFWLCRVWRFQLLCFSSCLRRWSSLTNVTNPSIGTHPQCAKDEWLKPPPVGGSYNEVLGLALKVATHFEIWRQEFTPLYLEPLGFLGHEIWRDLWPMALKKGGQQQNCLEHAWRMEEICLVGGVLFFFSFFVPFCTFGWLNRQAGWLRVGSRERCLAYRSTCIHILWNSLSVF